MEENVTNHMGIVIELATRYGINFIFAILILIIGFWVSARVKRVVLNACSSSPKIDNTLGAFFSSLARYVIIIFTILAVLDRFGVETASLIAILGAASLAIGLALQGTLSNVASGVMLLIFRPFKVGEFVDVGGLEGTVKMLGLFFTEMATSDNIKIIVPNSKIWGSAIKNYSANKTRRIDLLIGISYGDDIDHAITELNKVLETDSRILKDPSSTIFVNELGESSVNLGIRVWVEGSNYSAVRWNLIKNIKQNFDKNDLNFPYPQHDIHIISQPE